MGLAIPYSRTIVWGIPWYSALIVAGILLAILFGEKEERRLGLPRDTVIDAALVTVPCGIIGARLYYVAMTWETFAANPISILFTWEGGVAIYGAIIGGALGLMIYARRKKLSFLVLLDMLIPGVLLAQAIGRWGNYFNMEAYGPEILNPMLQFFPFGVLIPNGGGYTWHMATFFYESLWNACGFCALWAMRKKQKEAGNVFFWYLLIYGSGRFIIEQLREDSLYLGSIRVSQLLSLVLCAVAAALLLWRAAGSRRKLFATAAAGVAALIARWFALGNPWLYGILLLTGLVCCGITVFMSRRSGGRAVWLLLILLPDALTLIFMLLAPSAQTVLAIQLQALVCSLTLPLFVGWSTACMRTNDEEGR